MKEKMIGSLVLVMHIVVLAGFSLMQGCTTGDSPVRWLNWPYSTPQDKPAVLPAEDYTTGGLFPAGSYVPPPAAPVVVPLPESRVYVVQKGDTLSAIAAANGVSWKALADFNNITNPNQLRVGQEIRIPGASAPAVRAPSAAPSVSRPSASPIKQGSSYTIQKGDSLSLIAKRSGLTVNEIKVANSLTGDNIIAGKSLTIPRKGDVKAPAVAKPAPVAAANPVPAPAAVSAAAPSSPSAPVLSVPAPAPIAEANPVVPPVASAAPVYEHVLYPGETLDDVARQYGSSQQEIMKLNNISDASTVRPGTKLLVPIPD